MRIISFFFFGVLVCVGCYLAMSKQIDVYSTQGSTQGTNRGSAAASPRVPSSVMANHAHMMGETAPVCTKWTDIVSPQHQTVINHVMADRTHRLHHALWHAVRGGMSASDKTTLKQTFGPTWSDSNALCPVPDANYTAADYNPAGEDFLYMHRQMVGMLRAAFIAANLPCVTGWKSVPSPKVAPLPDSNRSDAKSPQTLALLQKWDQHFRDPAWLKTKSLSQVGWALEYSVHNNLHMRYATELPPKGFSEDGAPISVDGKFPGNWAYDDVKYNWLADPYGAAVNPTFWKIHGYVDSIIDVWLAANGFAKAADDCDGEAACYQWKGRWTGELELPSPDPASSKNLPRASAPWNPSPAEQDAILKFSRRRMKLQRLGV